MAKGAMHYTKDGKKYTGASHKMPNGQLHSGRTHTDKSVRLFHYRDLSKKAKEVARKKK